MQQNSIKRKFSKTGKLTLIDTVDDTQVSPPPRSGCSLPLETNPPLQVQELFSVVESQARATSNKRSAPAIRHDTKLPGAVLVCCARAITRHVCSAPGKTRSSSGE